MAGRTVGGQPEVRGSMGPNTCARPKHHPQAMQSSSRLLYSFHTRATDFGTGMKSCDFGTGMILAQIWVDPLGCCYATKGKGESICI